MRVINSKRLAGGRSISLAALCAVTLLAAGCGGGGDDPAPVASDPAATPAPAPGTTPTPANPDDGPAADAVPAQAGDPAVGTVAPTLPGSTPATVELPCRVDGLEGTPPKLETHEFTINRGTNTLLVDGVGKVANTFKWASSREYRSKVDTPQADGGLLEVTAKFRPDGDATTYYREKVSKANLSRVSQIECFVGLTLTP